MYIYIYIRVQWKKFWTIEYSDLRDLLRVPAWSDKVLGFNDGGVTGGLALFWGNRFATPPSSAFETLGQELASEGSRSGDGGLR